MYQLLKFNEPIPSCSINSIEFIDGKWVFNYALNTPFELTDDNRNDLIVYEYISDLFVKNAEGLHHESVNVHFKTLTEYLSLLKRQQEEDINFRIAWKENNPDALPLTITLENKNYSLQELKKLNVNFIASIVNLDSEFTEFAAI